MLAYIFLLLFVTISVVFAAENIKFSKKPASRRFARSMIEEDPCLDYAKVDSSNRLKFPKRFAKLSPPWKKLAGQLTLYESHGLQYQWTWLKSLNVRGVNPPQTLDDIIRFLESVRCFFLPFGEVVRNSVLRQHPKQTTGEVSCDIMKLYESCQKKYGKHSCGLYPIPIRLRNGKNDTLAYRLEIGDATYNSSIDEIRSEPLHVYPWGYFFGRPAREMTYSVDALSIFDRGTGHIYLVDITGHGLTDVCEKKIETTVEDTKQWREWARDDVQKMLEFYYLRWRGFSVGNSALQPFINDVLENNYDKRAIQTFYCERILRGVVVWAGESSTTTCHIVFPDNEERHAIADAKEMLTHEMGPNLSPKIVEIIDEIEAIYVTNSQFVQIRNRQANRTQIYQDANPKLRNISTRVVGGGPLVQDVGDVHRRPILWKTEAPSELPADFPSVAHAKPDTRTQQLEFRPQQIPEISVYENPVAYEQDEWNANERPGDRLEDRTMKRGTDRVIAPEPARVRENSLTLLLSISMLMLLINELRLFV